MSDTTTAPLEAEATGTPVTVDFDGHTYELLPGQPGPKALTHLADSVDQDSMLFQILYVREIIGRDAWDTWCERHNRDQISDFIVAVGKAAAGGNPGN